MSPISRQNQLIANLICVEVHQPICLGQKVSYVSRTGKE